MKRVGLSVAGFAHQTPGADQITPVVGVWCGPLSLDLTFDEVDGLRSALERAKIDAATALETARSNPSLHAAVPAGTA